MKLRSFVSALAVMGSVLVACGSDGADAICDQQQECATKASKSFSVTECKKNNVKAREEADTQGCSDEYDEAESCIAGLDFECADFQGDGFGRKSLAECGSKIERYNKCK